MKLQLINNTYGSMNKCGFLNKESIIIIIDLQMCRFFKLAVIVSDTKVTKYGIRAWIPGSCINDSIANCCNLESVDLIDSVIFS